ncbi:hypothetical protein [Pelagicoccus sp. SDUM812003]|uniref:hypothetical protein n=1 Tax=Pelagicoccus sp. SDUM812003 TaxID=3041267 RepID=UPI00280E7A57|nr:hypothetical protein [Pelagicoccus sp. SDUM812003]MDQ8204005.1 hypothetical protein [Pelagicoccus sp. SDUM812003]
MKNKERNQVGESSCNDLLRVELAAVEIYELADKLLGEESDAPDYASLREGHRSQVEQLMAYLKSIDGAARPQELSWDRPRTAILAAATIYGSESPLDLLRQQEEEIVETYQQAVEHGPKAGTAGGAFLAGQLARSRALCDRVKAFAEQESRESVEQDVEHLDTQRERKRDAVA